MHPSVTSPPDQHQAHQDQGAHSPSGEADKPGRRGSPSKHAPAQYRRRCHQQNNTTILQHNKGPATTTAAEHALCGGAAGGGPKLHHSGTQRTDAREREQATKQAEGEAQSRRLQSMTPRQAAPTRACQDTQLLYNNPLPTDATRASRACRAPCSAQQAPRPRAINSGPRSSWAHAAAAHGYPPRPSRCRGPPPAARRRHKHRRTGRSASCTGPRQHALRR
jgi:hypothetical protein